MAENKRPPLPPFTYESAVKKVRAAENAWNTRNPEKVSLAAGTAPRGSSRPFRIRPVACGYRFERTLSG